MATKNCPKCDSPNPVACKKCACGHVFFTTRRSANALAADANEDLSEPTTPQEPELPRRRTARVTRERPQFYDALQVENQTRRQRELQKRRKASKSDDAEVGAEDVPEKPAVVPTTSKRRVESPPPKATEPTPKKRRGRPPGLTSRRSGRAQILVSKPNDGHIKGIDGQDGSLDTEVEGVAGMHDIPPLKALQMNMVLSDINSRISSSSVQADYIITGFMKTEPDETDEDEPEEKKPSPEKTKGIRKGSKEVAVKPEADVEAQVKFSRPTVKFIKEEVLDSDEEPLVSVKEEVESSPESTSAAEPPKSIKKETLNNESVGDSADDKGEAVGIEASPTMPKSEETETETNEPESSDAQAASSTTKGCAFPC